MYPDRRCRRIDYPEIYVGFNAGAFSFKQWYSRRLLRTGHRRASTPKRTTPRSISDAFSLAFHAGYAWGDYWDDIGAQFDYAVQANYTCRPLHDLRQVHWNRCQR